MVSARGFDGLVEFDGRTVTIRREGVRARTLHGGAGSVSIPVEQVAAVEFVAPSRARVQGWHGRLTFVVAGAAPRVDNVRGRARFDDPFTVEFGRGAGEFEAVRDAVNAAVAGLRAVPVAPVWSVPAAQPGVGGLADQLAQLGELYRRGVLSAAEFEAAKARLLG